MRFPTAPIAVPRGALMAAEWQCESVVSSLDALIHYTYLSDITHKTKEGV